MADRLQRHVSDDEIVTLLRQGDDSALVDLYRLCRPSVTSLVLRNSGTTDDAEDMLQEALVVLWERVRAGKFTSEAAPRTFVVAVVKNMWLRRLARKRREPSLSPDEDAAPDGSPDQLAELVREERAAEVQRAVDAMGDPCRTLLLLFYYEELSLDEIARRMGFANANTVKSKKYQCKRLLQRRIGLSEATNA